MKDSILRLGCFTVNAYSERDMSKHYSSFSSFYPFYLSQHENTTCRRLHFFGSLTGLLIALYGVFAAMYALLLLALVVGYAFAWIGHFFFEKNKPATFRYPLYSYCGDWVMFKDIICGKIKF